MIDDLLDARDDLEALLDQALPALEARPTAEGAEMLAVLLVAPYRRTGPGQRLRRLVVRRLERRATPAAAAVLQAIALLGDADTAPRAAEAVARLREAGVEPGIDGIGTIELGAGWRLEHPPAEGVAVRVRRAVEPHERLLKLWLEPGESGEAGQPGAAAERGVLAGGWTDPLEPRKLEKDRVRFQRQAEVEHADELDATQAAEAIDTLVRRAGQLDLALSEGVALVLAQLARAGGATGWPDFDVIAGGP